MTRSGKPIRPPSVKALPLWGASTGKVAELLTESEAAVLGQIASEVQFSKGARVYLQGEPAQAVLNIREGVVKACNTGPDGSEHIVCFLFPGDVLGLAEEGRYVNTVIAVTPVKALKVPTAPLEKLLKQNAALEFHVITKLTHELRSSQRHALLLTQRGTVERLALFLRLLERNQFANGQATDRIFLPMSRGEIANYLAISASALSRSFAELVRRRAIALGGRQFVTLVDRHRFAAILGEDADAPALR
jgi:CRP/FNR family transcriptional regulator